MHAARDRADQPVHRQRVVVGEVGDQPGGRAARRRGGSAAGPPRARRRRTAPPSRRRRARPRSFWICALAPTSTPRVGSSRISTLGSVISQRASSTFCWLPPLSVPTCCSGFAGRMSSAEIHFCDQLVLAPARDRTRPAARGLQREDDVLAHRQLLHEPLGAAVLRAERDAVRRGGAHAAQRVAGPDRHAARGRRDRRRTAAARPPCAPSRAARRSPTTSPRAQLEVERRDRAVAAETLRAQHRRALAARTFGPLLERLQRLGLAAEHARDELDLAELRRRPTRRRACRCAARSCGRRSRRPGRGSARRRRSPCPRPSGGA